MKKLFIFLFMIACGGMLFSQNSQNPAPPNLPAELKCDGQTLNLTYNGSVVLKVSVNSKPDEFYIRSVTDSAGGKINQVFTITSKSGKKLLLEGVVSGSEESFPCQADPQIKGTVVVRSSYGPSRSLLNRAVYDRKNDWVLSVDESYASADLKIIPVETVNNSNNISLRINGSEITFRFRPRFYSVHRGLKYFEPWNYKAWQKPVVGWCSWFAFKDKVTEDDIKKTADVLARVMKPFGLEYIQIDDGYQREASYPEMWLQANSKFPGGMESLAGYITSKGFVPGIWTNVAFSNKEYAEANSALFITDENGIPVKGRWIGYIMDGSNPAAIDQLIRPVYDGFASTGWKYFKLDALRHLRYEGYNSNPDYFKNKNADRVEAFRSVVKGVRSSIGKDNFLLACWGIRPELTGIADGCRIGDDGFGFQALTQYNSFNNIVWRNDPDHIELTPEEAYRSCTAASITGSLFMLTDKPEIYKTKLIEPAIRSIPVLYTLPGQIYDVDPSRSAYLDRVESEMSGSGERIFDASRTSPYDLFSLELNTSFDSWLVLGRLGSSVPSIKFSELGLSSEKEYLVFEFWSKNFLGVFKNGFKFGNIDTAFNCQVFAVREKLDHPQLIATNRHISCGALELERLEWTQKSLRGKSNIVGGDTYTIYLHENENYFFDSVTCGEAKITMNEKSGDVRKISFDSAESKSINWVVNYISN